MCSGMGRAVLGQESGYLTLPHASQGASARISTFRAPVPLAAQREGSQLACEDSKSKTRMRRSLLHSRAYRAQRQMRLHSSSSLYDGRHTRPRCTRTRDRRDRGCVGLDPFREAEDMQISACCCSLVSRTFCPGFLPTFQITLSVSYWLPFSPLRLGPCTPSLCCSLLLPNQDFSDLGDQ